MDSKLIGRNSIGIPLKLYVPFYIHHSNFATRKRNKKIKKFKNKKLIKKE